MYRAVGRVFSAGIAAQHARGYSEFMRQKPETASASGAFVKTSNSNETKGIERGRLNLTAERPSQHLTMLEASMPFVAFRVSITSAALATIDR